MNRSYHKNVWHNWIRRKREMFSFSVFSRGYLQETLFIRILSVVLIMDLPGAYQNTA